MSVLINESKLWGVGASCANVIKLLIQLLSTSVIVRFSNKALGLVLRAKFRAWLPCLIWGRLAVGCQWGAYYDEMIYQK